MTSQLTFQSTLLLNPKQLEDIIRAAVEDNSQVPMKVKKVTFKTKYVEDPNGSETDDCYKFVGAELELEIAGKHYLKP